MPVPAGQPINPLQTRRKILGSADTLFYKRGTLPVGVNEIADAAGVSKLTLYRHFNSKDGLIAAVLEGRSRDTLTWLSTAADRPELSPRDRILAVFDALVAWFDSSDFCGCAVMNAAVEARGGASPAAEIARRHLVRVEALFAELAEAAGCAAPEALAAELTIAMEGATIVALNGGRASAVAHLRTVAETLLDARL